MARSIRSSTLETRASRLRLPVARKPIYVKVASGVGLGYRRNRTAGTWVARVADGKGANWTKAIANADDFEEANGELILDFWQAQEKARTLGHVAGGEDEFVKPATVAEAVESYEGDLRTRGRGCRECDAGPCPFDASAGRKIDCADDASRVAPVARRAREIAGPSHREPDVHCVEGDPQSGCAERSPDRQPARLGDGARDDPRRGAIPECHPVGSRGACHHRAAHRQSREFGLLIESRRSPARGSASWRGLEVQDLQADRPDPRLMMPSLKKGRGTKKVTERPVPIPKSLATRSGLFRRIGQRPQRCCQSRAARRGRNRIILGCSRASRRPQAKTQMK